MKFIKIAEITEGLDLALVVNTCAGPFYITQQIQWY
jgi:hypothetical protein